MARASSGPEASRGPGRAGDLGARFAPARCSVALAAWQVLIGEKPLLILATGIAVLGTGLGSGPAEDVARGGQAATGRARCGGRGEACCWSATRCGSSFTGPGSYHTLAHALDGNDLAAFGTLPRQSIGGQLLQPGQPVANPTERSERVFSAGHC